MYTYTYAYKYVCIHTHMHVSYKYADKYVCIHTHMLQLFAIHTYIPTYLHTYIPTYLHTYLHTYIRTYVHTYLHTYIPTYIPTYLHTYIPTYKYAQISEVLPVVVSKRGLGCVRDDQKRRFLEKHNFIGSTGLRDGNQCTRAVNMCAHDSHKTPHKLPASISYGYTMPCAAISAYVVCAQRSASMARRHSVIRI